MHLFKLHFTPMSYLSLNFEIHRLGHHTPEIPEFAILAIRVEGDVVAGVSVAPSVAEPHIIAGVCHHVCCGRGKTMMLNSHSQSIANLVVYIFLPMPFNFITLS